MNNIEAILFDQGEVLFTNDWEFHCPEKDNLFYGHYQITPDQFKIARKKYIEDLFRGRISEEKYWRSVLGSTKAKDREPSFAIKLARKYQEWKPGMKHLIELLKKRGHVLAIISTTHKEMIKYKIDKFGLNQLFDCIITSCETGYMKPELEIFDVVLSELRVEAKNVIFFDDTKIHVSAARKKGMNAYRFQDCIHTERILKRYYLL